MFKATLSKPSLLQPFTALQLNLPASHQQKGLSVSIARDAAEVAEAQRLRYKIFAEELGAELSGKDGLDIDGFEAFCDHLLVRDTETSQVIGTYRILSPHQAFEAGGYYSAGEFDLLSRLSHLLGSTVELGRACVHQNYRNGGTITMLWAGLAKCMQLHNYEYMIGCASVPISDGGHMATSLYHKLKDDYLSPPEYRVFPHNPLPIASLKNDLQVVCPLNQRLYATWRLYLWRACLRCHFQQGRYAGNVTFIYNQSEICSTFLKIICNAPI